MAEYRQYEMVELSWLHSEPEGSDVYIDLKARVTAPDGTVTKVKGFYAGDNKFVIRFLPLQSGRYYVDVTGEIDFDKYIEVKPHDEKHHGLVQPEGTHLQFTDGTYFESFGTTVYALAQQTDDLMDQTIDTLAHSPFNKVRMCVFPKDYHYNKNEPQHYAFHKKFNGKWDVNHPDFAFWDAFEDKITRLANLGIQVDLILFHPYDRWGFATMEQEDNLTYLDYLLRRFAAYPNLWWSLANEYDLCNAKNADDWQAFEDKIAADDPYRHMLSNHNCFEPYDFSHERVTHCSLQMRDMALVSLYQNKYHKPVLYDECCYEGNLVESWGNISGREMTNRFWKATISGGYCTHGETFLDPDCKDEDNAVVWWAKGGQLIGESPARIGFLRDIVESLPGPIDQELSGMSRMQPLLFMSEEQFNQAVENIPAVEGFDKSALKSFLKAMRAMDHDTLIRHFDFEVEYAGKVGEGDAFLFYTAEQCPAKHVLELPEDRTYTVTVADAWNMTKDVVATDASGKYTVKFPGRDMMAVIAVAND